MIKFLVLMAAIIVSVVFVFTRKDINFKSMVAGPACGETAPKIFSVKTTENEDANSSNEAFPLNDDAENWEQLVSKARMENKRIMIMYVTSVCRYCKLMEKSILVKEEVAKMISDNFIFITIQTNETGNDNKQIQQWRPDAYRLSKEHGVKGVPNFTICDPEGKAIGQAVGFMDQQKFIQWIQQQL